MSDIDVANVFDDNDDENSDEEREQRRRQKQRRREEDEEEEDDDEDGDEDAGDLRGKKRRKPSRRMDASRYLDIIADVDDDEEDEDEDEEYGKDDFLEVGAPEEGDMDDMNRRAAQHARLDRRQQELNDEDLARIAQDVTRRYRPTTQKFNGDMNEIPQRLLMPSVQDANLWQVRVRPGKERDIVFSLMRKSMDQELSAHPMQILSAFQRDSLSGMIYVEARSAQQVIQACNGLVGVYPSRGVILVPIEEMASLLQIKKKETTIIPGSWVRIRRGKYGGDLAQVLDIAENGEEVGLKFVPRIDLNPKDDTLMPDGKKRKKLGSGLSVGPRPPQHFFNYEEVVKAHGRRNVGKRNQVYVFGGETYRDGYIEKDFKVSALILENVNPTLDEIMKFTRQEDGGENDASVNLTVIAEASKKEAITVLQPGDHVEVFEGEQTGVHGVVESISKDIVTLRAKGMDIDGQKVDVPARSLRKRFKAGDHVKVMSGHNVDETGLVVGVSENIVTFLSDMSMQEVSVFSKDLREAAEVGASTNIIGNYELHDLVQIDPSTVGVIFKTERDTFRVLDQHGHVRQLQPHQISMRKDSDRAIATDAEGHVLRVKDNVKEVDGEGRKGQVLHIHQSFHAFLFNREIIENGGVFVTRTRMLVSAIPKVKPGAIDSTKMNPAMVGGAVAQMGGGGGANFRGPRDRLIGVSVSVKQGPYKAHIGVVKDVNGSVARVELQTGNKVITIDKSKLWRRNKDGGLESLEGFRPTNRFGEIPLNPTPSPFGQGQGQGQNPFAEDRNPYNQPSFNPNSGGRTPMPGRTPAYGGRTPMHPPGDSRTPAWNVSRTPNPYASGGKTPAWNANAQTPAWNSSSRTPNPYADGARTPGWGAGASRDPHGLARTPSQIGQPPGWDASNGSQTPRYNHDRTDTWNPTVDDYDSAQTPAASAPTPSAWGNQGWGTGGGWDNTRGSNAFYAETPAASAPTPAAAETPYQSYMGDDNDPEHEHWIFQYKVENKKGLVVNIIPGTEGPMDRYDHGKFDNRRGTILSLQDPGKLDRAFVLVKFMDDGSTRNVPLRYVTHATPERRGDRVILLDDQGAFVAGTVCTVSGTPAEGMVALTSEQGSLPMVKANSVCLYQNVE